jgi:hypothetical protein
MELFKRGSEKFVSALSSEITAHIIAISFPAALGGGALVFPGYREFFLASMIGVLVTYAWDFGRWRWEYRNERWVYLRRYISIHLSDSGKKLKFVSVTKFRSRIRGLTEIEAEFAWSGETKDLAHKMIPLSNDYTIEPQEEKDGWVRVKFKFERAIGKWRTKEVGFSLELDEPNRTYKKYLGFKGSPFMFGLFSKLIYEISCDADNNGEPPIDLDRAVVQIFRDAAELRLGYQARQLNEHLRRSNNGGRYWARRPIEPDRYYQLSYRLTR